jgi:hypothetical protein
MVRASACLRHCRYSHGFNPNLLKTVESEGAGGEAVLNKVHKKKKIKYLH